MKKKQTYWYNPYTGELVQHSPFNFKFLAVRYFRRDCAMYCTIKWRDIKKVRV